MKPEKLSEKQAIKLHRLIIFIIVICVAITSISLSPDSQRLMKEHHTDEVLQVIDGWVYKFEVSDENDRTHKLDAYMALSDFQTQRSNHTIQCDRIDSEFDMALSHIADWFFNNYSNMVNRIDDEAAGNSYEIQQYLSNLSAEIDKYSDFFASTDDNKFVDRAYRAELFAELYDMHTSFIEDDYIPVRIDKNESLVEELSEIKSLIEGESTIDAERLTILHNKIDSLIIIYTDPDRAENIEAETTGILDKFDTELSLQIIWFEEHYSWLIEQIENMEIKDEYDDATLKNQIAGLEHVKQYIEDDLVVDADFQQSKNEQIDKLTEEYEGELALVTERIKERELKAANAAAANAANANNNNSSASSTSNNRSGTSNNNTSGNSSSSSGAAQSSSAPAAPSSSRELLARLIKLEAPNECADGKQAIAEVVLNRARSSRWNHANTVEEVIFDTRWGVQFTVKDLIWTDRGTPSSSDYAAADRALGGSSVLGRDYMFFATTPRTQNDVVWIGNHAFSK